MNNWNANVISTNGKNKLICFTNIFFFGNKRISRTKIIKRVMITIGFFVTPQISRSNIVIRNFTFGFIWIKCCLKIFLTVNEHKYAQIVF